MLAVLGDILMLTIIIYVLAILFTIAAIYAVDSYYRFGDVEMKSITPALFYEAIYYWIFPYIDPDMRMIYGRWGVLGLSISLCTYIVWRHYKLRGGTWRFLKR